MVNEYHNIITDEKLNEAMLQVNSAIKKIKIVPPEYSSLYVIARDAYDMVTNYFKDSQYFRDHGDLVNAFGALYYAYGWIDSCVRMGLFDAGEDHTNFTLFK
ncbi:MAG: DUF357 domain-containing protein [Thermoplasmata archaeon]